MNIHPPRLKPLPADQVAHIFFSDLVCDLIPFLKVLDQFLLQLLLKKDVKDLSVFAIVDVPWRLFYPILYSQVRSLAQKQLDNCVTIHLLVFHILVYTIPTADVMCIQVEQQD